MVQNRSPWQRSHSHPVNLQTKDSRPLQPVSTVTKNKLNKFQYQPRPDDLSKDDATDDARTNGLDAEKRSPQSRSKSRDTSAVTPVTRLTWQDLIEPNGAAQDNTNTSPNERLMWDNKQDPGYASALSPMVARKGRKRARSSSPTSSPAADKPTTPAVNVKKLAKALKSPHADPTLELWDRYSLNGSESVNTPMGIANPALAHLMVSSSPRPLKETTGQHQHGDASLRRVVSCGQNWPKRRKIEKPKSGSQASGEQRELEAASKSSLVTALLDTVTSSIHDLSHDEGMGQILESPSPKKRRLSAAKNASPRRPSDNKNPLAPLSDYGDDDFDDDTFMELEASIAASQLPVSAAPTRVDSPKSKDNRQMVDQTTNKDEFDDLDDGIFDDAEDLIAGALSQHFPQTPAKASHHVGTRSDPVDLDDEFGGDFDGDIDFEAVEMAATQLAQPPKVSSQLPVESPI